MGVFENGVVHGSAVYPQMAIGIEKMMINRRFMGYPIFRQTQMDPNGSNRKRLVATCCCDSCCESIRVDPEAPCV